LIAGQAGAKRALEADVFRRKIRRNKWLDKNE